MKVALAQLIATVVTFGGSLVGGAALKDAAKILVAALISDAISNVTFTLSAEMGLPPILCTLLAIMAGIAAGKLANKWLLPDGSLDTKSMMDFAEEHADEIDDFAKRNGLKSSELIDILGKNYDELTDAQKRLYDGFYETIYRITLPPPQQYSNTEIDDILNNLRGNGFKNNPLRMEYESEVAKLADKADELLRQGHTEEEVARMMHQARRDLGVTYKEATPQPLRDYIYYLNEGRYGDPLGPSFEKMVKNKKTYKQIIDSSSRYNPDIDGLLVGFEEWLRSQL